MTALTRPAERQGGLDVGIACVSLGYEEKPVNQQGASGTRIRNRYQPAVHQIMINHRIQSHDGYEVPFRTAVHRLATADDPVVPQAAMGTSIRPLRSLLAGNESNFSRRIACRSLACSLGCSSIRGTRESLVGYPCTGMTARDDQTRSDAASWVTRILPGYPDLRYGFVERLTASHDVDTDYLHVRIRLGWEPYG